MLRWSLVLSVSALTHKDNSKRKLSLRFDSLCMNGLVIEPATIHGIRHLLSSKVFFQDRLNNGFLKHYSEFFFKIYQNLYQIF